MAKQAVVFILLWIAQRITGVAEPIVWQLGFAQWRVNAAEMKGSSAAIAAYKIPIASARRAIVVVVILKYEVSFLWRYFVVIISANAGPEIGASIANLASLFRAPADCVCFALLRRNTTCVKTRRAERRDGPAVNEEYTDAT